MAAVVASAVSPNVGVSNVRAPPSARGRTRLGVVSGARDDVSPLFVSSRTTLRLSARGDRRRRKVRGELGFRTGFGVPASAAARTTGDAAADDDGLELRTERVRPMSSTLRPSISSEFACPRLTDTFALEAIPSPFAEGGGERYSYGLGQKFVDDADCVLLNALRYEVRARPRFDLVQLFFRRVLRG